MDTQDQVFRLISSIKNNADVLDSTLLNGEAGIKFDEYEEEQCFYARRYVNLFIETVSEAARWLIRDKAWRLQKAKEGIF